MRPSFVPLIAAFALACAGGDPDDTGVTDDTGPVDDTGVVDDTGDSGDTDSGDTDSGDTDSGDTDSGDTDTDDTDDTDDTEPPPVEDCGEPGDEDGNSLADCEDPACATDVHCYEVDCTDLSDDDNDGHTDCQDEDCWGRECGGTIATVKGVAGIDRMRQFDRFSQTCTIGSATYLSSSFNEQFTMSNVSGTVKVLAAGAGTDWKTCDWTLAAQIGSVDGNHSGLALPAMPVLNSGMVVTGNCGLTSASTAFLPKFLAPRDLSGNRFEVRHSEYGTAGDLWIDTSTFTSTSTSSLTTSGTTYNSTTFWYPTTSGSTFTYTTTLFCTYRGYTGSQSWQAAGLEGAPFPQPLP